MILRQAKDLEPQDLAKSKYDLAIFASGYEERCTFVPSTISTSQVSIPLIVGFEALASDEQRGENDKFYIKHWTNEQLIVPADDESKIYDILRTMTLPKKDSLRVLVDYSSMSRLWYAGILNWARFTSPSPIVEIDFAYTPGRYSKNNLPPLVIQEMLSIPGFEGGTARLKRSVVIFGLGFAGEAALCLLDRLEPDLVYAYLASSGDLDEYAKITRAQNRVLLEEHALRTLELPLGSVDTTFSYLAELAAFHQTDSELTLAPMGPKPHVLAGMLVALRFDNIACLRVSTTRQRPDRIPPKNRIIATRVVFSSSP